ncbi:Uncharacterised protein [Mycobacteroides abscessus subsp. abscessus]|nr:Uncharacterised protein [Mycobacteroides abscessus subsp. abscessus]
MVPSPLIIRCRGPVRSSSPSLRAKTTQSASRCSRTARTTERTRFSGPSAVCTSAREILSSAPTTRVSRCSTPRYCA